MCVSFRRHTLLPLEDCLYALQASIPRLSRSALHRLYQRHEISGLPDVEGDKPKRSKFRRDPSASAGHRGSIHDVFSASLHIDIAEVRTEESRLYLFVAIDRTSKFAFVKLVEKAGRMAAAQFLRDVIAAVPYRIHTVLTDNGVQFTNRTRDHSAFQHIFGRVCSENDIEHRKTKLNHPWSHEDRKTVRGSVFSSGGQVERMNRTIKEGEAQSRSGGSAKAERSAIPLRGYVKSRRSTVADHVLPKLREV